MALSMSWYPRKSFISRPEEMEYSLCPKPGRCGATSDWSTGVGSDIRFSSLGLILRLDLLGIKPAYVRRIDAISDKRAQIFVLTKLGQKFLEDAIAITGSIDAELEKSLGKIVANYI